MRKRQSALVTVLKALMPYSRENLSLSFSPNRFFNDLERNSSYSKATLRHSYERARREKLIQQRSPKLTKEGIKTVKPFVAEKLKGQASLMIIFDIPEKRASDRKHLREILKGLDFVQVQKSVWVSNKDHRSYLIEVISELGLGAYVEIFESARIYP